MKKSKTLKPTLLLFFLFSLSAHRTAFPAEITMPELEMATRAASDGNGEFVLSSVFSADIALTGGYKYAFLLGFSLDAPDISRAFSYGSRTVEPVPSGDPVDADDYNSLADRLNNQAFLGFRAAKATARDIFGLPLELSYFMGAGDDFCSGDDFALRFGTAPFGTDFRGFFYFPEGIGGAAGRRYNGIHGAKGTGFSFALTKWDFFVPVLYLYQDFSLFGNSSGGAGSGLFSEDIRLLFNHAWLQAEIFAGASQERDAGLSVRGGLMFHFAPENGAEFFAQAGITNWFLGEEFSIDHFYFLMEPALHLGAVSLSAVFFYHPVEYLHVITPEERGRADINLKFRLGNRDSGFSGGIEAGGDLKIDGLEDFGFRLSPFASFVSGGVKWDVKMVFKPLESLEPKEMIEVFAGVRTAF